MLKTNDSKSPGAPLSPEQKRARLAALLQARSGAPSRALHQLFEEQAANAPTAIALTLEGQHVTYRELNARANRLARRLRHLGVEPESLVAIYADRSVEMIVGLLAILKAGGAYVPLDPVHPPERLGFQLNDCRARILLAQRALIDRLPAHEAYVVALDEDIAEDSENLDADVRPDHLAYVIYTSGSTGTPKGVPVTHANVVRLFTATQHWFGFNMGDVWTLFHSFAFDFSVWEIWGALLYGGRLVVVPYWVSRSPEAFHELLRQERVTVLNQTPSAFRQLVRADESAGVDDLSLRWVIFGGEALELQSLRPWFDRHGDARPQLVNMYGITETTVHVTYRPIVRSDLETCAGSSPIGRPIPDLRFYLLDRNMQPVPPGVVGEIYVGGEGVARGYLFRPALTAERFVVDPFASEPGARLYRSGDLARRRRDGEIEYQGRADRQVKIRGFRIELGEIEAALARQPELREAAVVALADPHGDTRLAAYLVARNGQTPSSADLRARLKQGLPDYMVPSAFVVLDALPLTPNGKLDVDSLPSPQWGAGSDAEYVAPSTPTEEAVAAIWGEVLGIEKVGVRSDFFALGGHSLLAAQVVSRLRQAFPAEIPLRSLFESPTVAGLAERIDAAGQGSQILAPIARVARDGELPLSFSQQALWFLDRLAPGLPTFNVPGAVRITGPLDVAALERSFHEILRRHESLRTTFPVVDGSAVQVIAPALAPPLEAIDLSRSEEPNNSPPWEGGVRGGGEQTIAFSHNRPITAEAEARQLAAAEARRPFDLARGPLARAQLLRLGPTDHIMLLTLHHIVTDGWSMGVAAEELAVLYESYRTGTPSPLPEPSIQYADYAAWQRDWLRGENLERLLAYWSQQLADLPALELPTDRPRPAIRSARGDTQFFTIPPELVASLRALSRNEGATLFMTLLAAFETLLHRYSGQDDFAIGVPVANRNRPEAEGLIGYFVNMLALRADLSDDPTFRTLLGRVRETALGAFEHQELPFDKLVEALQPARDPSRTPLFDVMFVLQNNRMPDVTRQELTLSHFESGEGTGTAKFDLTLAVEEFAEETIGSLEYNTDLFDDATIERMLGHFMALLEDVVVHPDRRVSEISLMGDSERVRVLEEWNGMGPGFTSAEGKTVVLAVADSPPPLAPPSQGGEFNLFPTTHFPPPWEGGARGGGASSAPSAGKTPWPVHRLIESQVKRTPHAVALIHADRQLTYQELNARANQLARNLKHLGVGPEVRVGLCIDRSIEMAVGLLAILKADGAYLPLDPSEPKARLAATLKDATVNIVLTRAALSDALAELAVELVCIDADWNSFAAENLEGEVSPSNAAYVIYTSGSTGTPRGVVVPHRALVNHNVTAVRLFDLRPSDRVLQFAPLSFDISVEEIFPTWITGATLVLRPDDSVLDPVTFTDWIERERISVLDLPTAYWHAWVDRLSRLGRSPGGTLRLVIVGGEKALPATLSLWRELTAGRVRWLNTYGPTETTVIATAHEPSADWDARSDLPIGRPITNARVYVLDQHLQPLPIGLPGELYIGGAGVSRGYLARPATTAEKFLPDPFGCEPGARLFRTGDRALWRADGELVFLGRIDHQAKISGFRVEPGEIESALLECPGVRAASVVVRSGEGGNNRLDAYIVALSERTLAAADLREFLRDRLPKHMIPATFTLLESLPLTASGKVDRKALPAPDRVESGRVVVAARDDVELKLVELWEELLGVRPIGVTESFFDLGGHSLLAVRLLARVEETFGRPIPLASLFLGATVADLAARVRESAQPWTPLATLQPLGQQPPFFCIHPAGGIVYCFLELAQRLGSDRPFHAFQAAGLEQGTVPVRRLEDMAASYVNALRETQPDGPYHLGGWSLGGIVAFEMAQQLHAQGHEVATLALFDSHAPIPLADAVRPLHDLAQEAAALDLFREGTETSDGPTVEDAAVLLGLFAQMASGVWFQPRRLLRHLRGLGPDEQRAHVLKLFKLDEVYHREIGPEPVRRLWNVLRTNLLAAARYTPQHYPGRIVLFRAGAASAGDATMGWGPLASDVTVHAIPGDHASILREPGVGVLAKALEAELKGNATES